MKENTNSALAINTLILYFRLFLTSIFSLFTARYSLQALGVSDFGLFSVVASFISFMGIFNTIMISTSNRFIAVAIGKGDIEQVNKQFNINLVIHSIIALLTLIIAFPLCDWYILKYINYEGDIQNALIVFRFSIISAIISFVGVPYNGLLMARERFIVFCGTDIVSCFLKMIFSYYLIDHFDNKLILFAIVTAVLTAYPTVVFISYCYYYFRDIVKINFVKGYSNYKEVLSFSMWVSYGAVATVGKNQGAALLVNVFFNTIMNTALGIATSVNSVIVSFAQNVSRPISPQITKSYVSGDESRTVKLMIMSSKFTFLMMLLVSSPFLVDADSILRLWLGQVPHYASMFIILLIIDALVDSLNAGVSEVIFASGKIKLFQITINTIRLVAIAAAYFVLRLGGPAYSMFYAYIAFTIIAFFVRQWVLYRTLHYNLMFFVKKSYLPSVVVFAFFLPSLMLKNYIPGIPSIIISLCYICILILYIGLSKDERKYLYFNIIHKFKK